MTRTQEAERYAEAVGIPEPVRRVALDHLAMVGDEGHWLITAEHPRTIKMVVRVLGAWAAKEHEGIKAVDQELLVGFLVGLRLRAYLTKAGRIPAAPGWGKVLEYPVPEVVLGRVDLGRGLEEVEVPVPPDLMAEVRRGALEGVSIVPDSPSRGSTEGPGVAQEATDGGGGRVTPTACLRAAQGVISARNGPVGVNPSYLLKALELAKAPDGVKANELAAVLGITPRHGRRVLEALVAAGALAREAGPVPRKRSPGKAPLVYRAAGGAA